MWLYIASYLVTVTLWVWAIMRFDKYEREPLRMILFMLIVGGLISCAPAGFFNEAFLYYLNARTGSHPTPATGNLMILFGFVGLNEETLKALVTVMLIRYSKNFNEPSDALIYSMTTALGFSVYENTLYTAELGLGNFFIRQLNAVPLHIGLATFWGMGIARARFINKGRYFTTLVPYILLAALLHAVYNFVCAVSDINRLSDLVISGVMAFVIILLSIRRLSRYQKESPFSNLSYCHHCHTSNKPGASHCQTCGREISMQFFRTCEGCLAKVKRSASYCPKCGKKLDAEPVQPE